MPEKHGRKQAKLTPEMEIIKYKPLKHALKIFVSDECAQEMAFGKKLMLGIMYPEKQIKVEVEKS